MWVLVVVLVSGNAMFSYTEGLPYSDLDQCQKDAQASYYSLMATRPAEDAYVVAYCAEVPKGV